MRIRERRRLREIELALHYDAPELARMFDEFGSDEIAGKRFRVRLAVSASVLLLIGATLCLAVGLILGASALGGLAVMTTLFTVVNEEAE